MSEVFGFFIRISAFLRKEVYEILRQPRLVLTLVLGPFLILLLFGLGYRVEAQPVRTLFVMEPNSPFRAYLDQYISGINPLLHFAGITDSVEEAQAELRQEKVDLVVVLPEDPAQTIRDSQQAVFTLYHNEIDPFQVDYIRAFARIYTDEINRRILTELAEQGQGETADVQTLVGDSRQVAGDLRASLESGDTEQANQQREQLASNIGLIGLALGGSAELVQGLEERFGTDESSMGALTNVLSDLQQRTNAMNEFEPGQDNYDEAVQQVSRIEEEIGVLETTLGDFQDISAGVLISPFRSDLQTVSEAPVRISDFYVPSAIALLVQHLALTFAALSIVRERQEGTIELFRVSPISALETLLGKYLSYFIFEFILIGILTALVLWGLQVPMLGSWSNYLLTISLLIFASLGLGFVISLIAENTSQAVQLSMIVLLASIFFSGFFLTLSLLRPFVRVVSWLLPATYATQSLQDIMLRGLFLDVDLLWSMGLMGLAFFVLAWLLLRRKMARR